LTEDRLEEDREGPVWLTLRHRWSDGMMHLNSSRSSFSIGWLC
jgi:hypothetical protein